MGRVVIVAMKPKQDCAATLRDLVRHHVPRLRAEGLATERAPIIVEARDGTVVEVFEWVSADAIEAAHGNPAVTAMWGEFAAVCDFLPIAQVPEAAELFSEFAPMG